jgi:5-methylthioadenosine/S-adenosylhomocysteine deaminase
MIDMGTTTAVDTSQVSHTPEHSDACIRALQESGMRVVYAYWRGSGPDMRYPQDIVRLQRTYFSSQDQLLTLALGAVLDTNVFTYAREVGVRCVSHGVSNNTERTLLELGRAGLLRPGDEYIHCTHLSDTRGACSRTPAPASPSPLPSRWQWATACRRSRPRSTTASVRA